MSREVCRDNSLYADAGQGLLTTEQAAQWLGISALTLKDWRYRGRGPKFVRDGHRLVRYQQSDIRDWIRRRIKGGDDA